jgi:branched-chain amino acid aminotransferase
MTPPLSSGALPGITRELVLEWTEACEEDLDYDILQSADEIFLTSSTRDVHPVSRVDSREIALGPVTARIRDIFRLKTSVDLDP